MIFKIYKLIDSNKIQTETFDLKDSSNFQNKIADTGNYPFAKATVMTIPNYGKIVLFSGRINDANDYTTIPESIGKIVNTKIPLLPSNSIYLTPKTVHGKEISEIINNPTFWGSAILEITKDGEIITYKNKDINSNITLFILNGIMYVVPDKK